MQNFLALSKYKLWIIALYVIIFPLFFVLAPNVLVYTFSAAHLATILFISASAFLFFYLLNYFLKIRKIKWQNLGLHKTFLVIAYALIFAVPEEIIFRGIIQSAIQIAINNIGFIAFLSSAIFGLAHLPNGSKGLHPKNWNWNFAVMTFVAGLPLSLIFSITNSLLIPTLLHAAFLIVYQLFTTEITA